MPKEFERSLRCARCDIDWPLAEKYKTCPSCGDDTDLGILDPITHDEARTIINELDRVAAKRANDNARMDEAFVQTWARDNGIDLARMATRADGVTECELI